MQLYESSDEFFKKKTGKTFAEWKLKLDSMEALEKGHTWITDILVNEHKLLPEWAEAVSIRYQKDAYMPKAM